MSGGLKPVGADVSLNFPPPSLWNSVLFVVRFRRDLLDFGIDMTVGDKQIEPAIVVIVEKSAAEARDVACWDRNSRFVAYFVEVALSGTR